MGRVSQSWNIADDPVEIVKLKNNPSAKAVLYEAAKVKGATLLQLQRGKFSVVINKGQGSADLVLEWNDK